MPDLVPDFVYRWMLRHAEGKDSGFWGHCNRRLTEEFGPDWPSWLPGIVRKNS